MKEIACQFGEHQRLSGILTKAVDGHKRQTIILVNAGLVAKYGPFRMYTSIARRLAKLGFNVFRFDLGDIGNSQPANLTSSLKIRTSKEIRAALDYLQSSFDSEEFILGGLCSGAEDSYRYAEEDLRVVGLILIDPFAYRTNGFLIHDFMYRIWRKVLRTFIYSVPEKDKKNLPDEGALNFIDYKQIDRDESERILNTLLKRNVWLHFLYTDGKISQFNHKSQLKKMFPELKNYSNFALDYLPYIEHTQMLEEDRICLYEAIENRLIKSFNKALDTRSVNLPDKRLLV